MIPIGYCTIPEALHTLEHFFDKQDALEWLEAGLLDGELQVFTERGRQYDVEVVRIPWEDVTCLGASWRRWIASGRVPFRESPEQTPESKARRDAWYKNPTGSPMPKFEYEPRTIEHKYSSCQLMLENDNFNRWLNALRNQLDMQAPSCAKSGAPGRPTSMHIVLLEHGRRVENGTHGGSRTAEAKALEGWLKKIHPDMPPLTYKTILNKLPPEFQPLLKISG
jgi:hypothetical protein